MDVPNNEPGGGARADRQGSAKRRPRWALLFLIAPFVALLYPPFYARLTPRLGGVPFFIWYQFAWIIAGSVITIAVYALERARSAR